MREFVWLECTSCSSRNYRTPKETRGADRLELKKILPQGAKTHGPQGIAEEVVICWWSVVSCPLLPTQLAFATDNGRLTTDQEGV